jgi:hypothetical protein
MDAMTMPYKLKDANILSELHPGDVITADLLVSQDPNADVLLDHIVVVAQGKPDYGPSGHYHVPAPGDAVPDFKLRNQDGRPIHLAQFKGKALLVTFIYTRCPLPELLPARDAQLCHSQSVGRRPCTVYAKTHLLCVSFDPEHDTPDRFAPMERLTWAATQGCLCALGFCRARTPPVLGEMASSSTWASRRGPMRHHAYAFNHADWSRWQGGTLLSGQRMDGGSRLLADVKQLAGKGLRRDILSFRNSADFETKSNFATIDPRSVRSMSTG